MRVVRSVHTQELGQVLAVRGPYLRVLWESLAYTWVLRGDVREVVLQ